MLNSRSIHGLTILFLISTLLACGGRQISAADGSISHDGQAPDGQIFSPDSGADGRAGCISNKECSATSYCAFGAGCGNQGPGACAPRPTGCTADCPGVCGCDGKTYCNACGAAAAGVSVVSAGPCGKPSGCAKNSECKAGEFCHIGSGCTVTGAMMGTCVKRPKSCQEIANPVCGCDGKTYGNPCSAYMEGMNVSFKGSCGATCMTIDNAYKLAVSEAKACNPYINMIQCTKKMYSSLTCACPTYVEPGNTSAMKTLAALENQWNLMKCQPAPCGLCKPIKGGGCKGKTSKGTCFDVSL